VAAVGAVHQHGGESVEITVEEPGKLGARFLSDTDDGPPRVQFIEPGGQISRHPEVQLGMTLLAVDGQVVSSYAQGMPLLKRAGRPVRLRFSAVAYGRVRPHSPNENVHTTDQTLELDQKTLELAKQDALDEVRRLYSKYNAEKLASVRALVAKHGEVKLLAMVRKKYQHVERATQAARPPRASNPDARRRWFWAVRVLRMARIFAGHSGGVELVLTAPGPLGVTLRSDHPLGPPRVQASEKDAKLARSWANFSLF
jgi:hypothetical protein